VTAVRSALARALDPASIAADLGITLDNWQACVLRSTEPRLALVCSRQVGKTLTCALRATQVAIAEPGSLTLIISPTQRQSDEAFRVVQSLWRRLGRPVPEVADNKRSLELESGSRVVSLPGDQGGIRGYASPRLVVIDEGAQVPDDTFNSITPMMAASARGQLLVASSPFGARGWFHQVATQPEHGYQVTRVLASECSRITPEHLAAEKARMSTVAYLSEYEAQFLEAAGSMFSADDIEALFTPTGRPQFDPATPFEVHPRV
jgi:hypothetical protein